MVVKLCGIDILKEVTHSLIFLTISGGPLEGDPRRDEF